MAKRIRRAIIILCLLVGFILISLISAGVLITRPSFQRYLLRHISNKIGYRIDIRSISISLTHGLGIGMHHIKVGSKKAPFAISCPDAFISYRISELIKGRFIPEKIIIMDPNIVINKTNVPSTKKGGFDKKKVFLLATTMASFQLRNAEISIKDLSLELSPMDIGIARKGENRLYVWLRGKGSIRGQGFSLDTHGNISLTKGDLIVARLEVNTRDLPLSLASVKDSLIFLKGTSNSKIRLSMTSEGELKATGVVEIKGMDLVLKGKHNQKTEYRFDSLSIDLTAGYSKRSITFHSVRIKEKDFCLNTRARIDLGKKGSPFISLNVTSSFMPFYSFKRIFPTCLLPGWLENRLFAILDRGRVKVLSFSINGTSDQINNLDEPENKDVLSGSLVMDGVCLTPRGIRYPLKDIKATVHLTKGNLLIKDISADFASSLINKADVIIKDLYQDNRHYFIKLDGSFRIEDLLSQVDMEFTPQVIITKAKALKKASGKLDIKMICEYEEPWNMPIFNNSSVSMRDLHLLFDKLDLPVHIRAGKFWIGNKGNYNFNGRGRLGRSQLRVSLFSDASLKRIKLDIRGDAYLDELLKRFVKKSSLHIDGPIGVDLHANNEKNRWNAEGSLHLTKHFHINISSLSLNPCDSRMDFSLNYIPDKILLLKKVYFRSKASSFHVTGSYKIKNNLLAVRFLTKGLSLRSLGLRAMTTKPLKGKVISHLQIKTLLDHPMSTLIYGKLKAKNISMRFKNKVSIERLGIGADFSGKRIKIGLLKGDIMGYPVSIKGRIKGWDGLRGNLHIRSDYVDLYQLRRFLKGKFKTNTRDKKGAVFLEKSNLEISLFIAKAMCKNISLKPITAKFALRKGDFYVHDLTGSFPDGRIKVNAHVIKGKNKRHPEAWFDASIKAKGTPVEDIFDCIGIKRYIDGRLYIKSHLYARAREAKGLISHLTGQAVIIVRDGKIYKAQPVLKILDLFSLSNILKNPLDIFKEGVPFDGIGTKAIMKDGIISSDKMFLKSNALNAAAKGRLDLKKNRIDMGVAIQPLNTIDSIIGKLPLVGYIIGGKNKKITLYYFEVKGPLNKVEVKQTPIKNLVNGTFGLLKRIFLSPIHIFKDMEKDIEEIEKDIKDM